MNTDLIEHAEDLEKLVLRAVFMGRSREELINDIQHLAKRYRNRFDEQEAEFIQSLASDEEKTVAFIS